MSTVWGGSTFDVTMEEGQREVSHLKRQIEDQTGAAAFQSKSGEEAKEACSVALCRNSYRCMLILVPGGFGVS